MRVSLSLIVGNLPDNPVLGSFARVHSPSPERRFEHAHVVEEELAVSVVDLDAEGIGHRVARLDLEFFFFSRDVARARVRGRRSTIAVHVRMALQPLYFPRPSSPIRRSRD